MAIAQSHDPSGIIITVRSGEEWVWEPGAAGQLEQGQEEVWISDVTFSDPAANELMFGNYLKASIHGFKFEDLLNDGYDPGDPSWTADPDNPPVWFDLLDVGGVVVDSFLVNPADPTQNGEFWFTGLIPGIYTVQERVADLPDHVMPSDTNQSIEILIFSGEEWVWEFGDPMLLPGQEEVRLFVCDLTFVASREGSVDELRQAFIDAGNGSLKGILRATDEPLVSTDIIGESNSAVVDLPLISQVAPTFFRVVAWYDNENAYALRCVDLVEYMNGRESA